MSWAAFLPIHWRNELKICAWHVSRTISGSSNASAKDFAVASQEVGEDKVEGANETTEIPITTQVRTPKNWQSIVNFYLLGHRIFFRLFP